jgi:hypothetical protein
MRKKRSQCAPVEDDDGRPSSGCVHFDSCLTGNFVMVFFFHGQALAP